MPETQILSNGASFIEKSKICQSKIDEISCCLCRVILNLSEIIGWMRTHYFNCDIRVKYLEDLALEDIAMIYHTSSIVVQYHGSAMANILFMRKGSVLVDISPWKQQHLFIRYQARNWSPAIQVRRACDNAIYGIYSWCCCLYRINMAA